MGHAVIAGWGIAVAFVADVVAPLALLVVLLRANFRHRRDSGSERDFRVLSAFYLGPGLAVAVFAVIDSLGFDGTGTVASVVVGLPGSLGPLAFNSTVMHLFFTRDEWASFGYPVVITLFQVGVLASGWLFFVALRRLIQLGNGRPLVA